MDRTGPDHQLIRRRILINHTPTILHGLDGTKLDIKVQLPVFKASYRLGLMERGGVPVALSVG